MPARKISRRRRSRGEKRKTTRRLSSWQKHVMAFAKAHRGHKFGKGGLFREARKTYHK